MQTFKKIFFGLKNWRVEWNVDEELIKQEIEEVKNNIDIQDEKSENFDDEQNKINEFKNKEDDLDWNIEESKTINFFEKIAFLKLWKDRKSEIASNIVDDSHSDKLYWIQFTLSSLIVALWLLMNSIPVVIWAMLISPIMNPIKTFAFAITTWNKHMYLRSIKTLVVSMLVAILASAFISFIVPFSTLTSEVMSRISPTIVDLFVALFSWAVAFLSLWFKKLQENVAWVAMSVALLPPLSVIWIGIFFMDFSVAQGSFLLFMANLVAILIIWVLAFYMFGFFPTNKKWQKRSFVIWAMVLLSLLVVSIPLQKSMSQISDNMKITNQITITSKNYLESMNSNIQVDKISFKNLSDDLLRVSTIINVPNNYLITTEDKNELTKLLSMATQKSVELDLNIVEISSAYVWEKKTDKDILIDNIAKVIHSTFKSVFIVDHRVVEQDSALVFLNLYTDKLVDKDDVYETVLQEVKQIYGTGWKLAIQWQDSNWMFKKSKTQQEKKIETQFYALFPNSELNLLTVNSMTKKLSGENHDYIYVDIDFVTPKSSYRAKQLLRDWKWVLEKYLNMDVIVNSKIEYFSEFEV